MGFLDWGPACDTPSKFRSGEFLGDCPAFLFPRNCFQGDNESLSKKTPKHRHRQRKNPKVDSWTLIKLFSELVLGSSCGILPLFVDFLIKKVENLEHIDDP